MKSTHLSIIVSMAILFAASELKAQQGDVRPTGREVTANRVITFNGAVKDASGQPRLGTVGITFTLYTSQEGGSSFMRIWRKLWKSRLPLR
jgi:hypothetical protein